MLLLGLNSWNNPGVVKQYMMGAQFVDAFWAEEDNESVSQFVADFKAEYDRSPRIFEALMFDTIQISSQALSIETTELLRKREAVLDGVLSVELSNSQTHSIRFDQNRRLERELLILEVSSDGIQKWEDPDAEEEEEEQKNTPSE